jgi:hypothetical protein
MSGSCQQATKNKSALSQRSLDLDIITLRRINIRAPNNSIINSNSALISDGNGQGIWSTITVGATSTSNTIATIKSLNIQLNRALLADGSGGTYWGIVQGETQGVEATSLANISSLLMSTIWVSSLTVNTSNINPQYSLDVNGILRASNILVGQTAEENSLRFSGASNLYDKTVIADIPSYLGPAGRDFLIYKSGENPGAVRVQTTGSFQVEILNSNLSWPNYSNVPANVPLRVDSTGVQMNSLRIPSLVTCNVFISDDYYSAGLNIYAAKLSNLNYYLDSTDMGSYLFFRSPSNVNLYPPGVTPNTAPQPIQGNFFVLKNLGANNINVYTDTITTFPIITSTTATFFYVGTPQNFWTPM